MWAWMWSAWIVSTGYVQNLQAVGQVVSFMTAHLGNPIPSLAIMEKIGTAFRTAVQRFAADNNIPLVRFGKDDRKVEVMRPYLARQARTGRSGVAAIGTAQEFQNVSPRRSARATTGFLGFVHQGRPAGDVFLFLDCGTLTLGRRSRHRRIRRLPAADDCVGARTRQRSGLLHGRRPVVPVSFFGYHISLQHVSWPLCPHRL